MVRNYLRNSNWCGITINYELHNLFTLMNSTTLPERNEREHLVRVSITIDDSEIWREMVIRDGIVPDGVSAMVQDMVDTHLKVDNGEF